MANVGTSEVLETFLRGTEMHAARLEQKRQNGELAGSMANAGTSEVPETLLATDSMAGNFALLSISLLDVKANYKGGRLKCFGIISGIGMGKAISVLVQQISDTLPPWKGIGLG